MNIPERSPFPASYNAIRFLLSVTYYPLIIQVGILTEYYISTVFVALFFILIIRSNYFVFLWRHTLWYKGFILIVYLGQIPFFINAMIFDGKTFIALESVFNFVVYVVYLSKLNETISKYEIDD